MHNAETASQFKSQCISRMKTAKYSGIELTNFLIGKSTLEIDDHYFYTKLYLSLYDYFFLNNVYKIMLILV